MEGDFRHRKLGKAERIAILLGAQFDVTPADMATHFKVSKRHVYRVLDETQGAIPGLLSGIECFRDLLGPPVSMVSRETQTDDERGANCVQELASNARSQRQTCATHTAQISRMRREIKSLKIQLAAANCRLRSLKDARENGEIDKAAEDVCTRDDEDVVEDGRLLDEMNELRRKNKFARKYSEELFRFSYIMLSYSPRAFQLAHQRIPLPSKSRIYTKFGGLAKKMETYLTDLRYTRRLIKAFGNARPPDIPAVCTLGVDAFAFRLFLRSAVSKEQLKYKLSLSQLRQIGPLLEDQTLLQEVIEEEEEEFERMEEELTKEKLDELFETFSYCFIFFLQPLDSSLPCVTLHLLPTCSGVATQCIRDTADKLKGLCQKEGIEIAYISADGDSGWNPKFHAMFKIAKQMRFTELGDYALNVYNECKRQNIPLAVTDLLHLVKAARGRYIDHHLVMLVRDTTTLTDYEAACKVLTCEPRSFTDKSHMGRMRDFYPIELFSVRNVITLFQAELFPDAFYFLTYTLLLLVIRVPFLRMDFRMQLLSAAYGLFSYVYDDIVKMSMDVDEKSSEEQPHLKVPQRYQASCEYITFTEISTMERILCTITAYASAFQLHSDDLRTDSLGTHLVEQRIGQSRKGCDCRWERMLSNFAHGAIRSMFLETDELEPYSRGRLKTAGCRLDGSADMLIDDFDPSLLCRVLINSLTEAGRVPEEFAECFEQVKRWLTVLDDAITKRNKEIGKLWLPNPAANATIIARLLKSSLKDFGFSQTSNQ